MSKLRVGQVWKTRAGQEVTITQFDGVPPYPFLANNHESYTESGTIYESYPSEDDLVELVKEAPDLSKPKMNDGGPAFPTSIQWDEKGGAGFGNEQASPNSTSHYNGMTLRQYAAIKLRVPNSGTDWLDDMIRVSLRDEAAAKAMQGMWASDSEGWHCSGAPDALASRAADAYAMADAMPKARGEEKMSTSDNPWIDYAKSRPEKGIVEWRIPSSAIPGMILIVAAYMRLRGAGFDTALSPAFDYWDGYSLHVPSGLQWRKAGSHNIRSCDEKVISIEGLDIAPCIYCGRVPSIETYDQRSPHQSALWRFHCCGWGSTPTMKDPREIEKVRRKAFSRAARYTCESGYASLAARGEEK